MKKAQIRHTGFQNKKMPQAYVFFEQGLCQIRESLNTNIISSEREIFKGGAFYYE